VVSPGTPVFTTNKTDRHDITEILLKEALNTINLTPLNYLVLQSLAFQHDEGYSRNAPCAQN
jgi:hypothetical protein